MKKKDKTASFEFPEDCSDLTKAKDIQFFKWVEKVNRRNRTDQRLLIITSWEFFLFSAKSFSHVLQLRKRFRWLDIKKITGKTIDDITITFHSDQIVNNESNNMGNKAKDQNTKKKTNNKSKSKEDDSKSENDELEEIGENGDQVLQIVAKGSRIFRKIHSFIISYSLECELPEIELPPSYKVDKSKVHPSVIFHMKMRMKADGHSLSKAAVNSIEHFISKKCHEMKLNQLKMILENLDYFLECMHWLPFVEKVIVPFSASYGSNSSQQKQDPIRLLNTFVPQSPYINELYFRGRVPIRFSGFVNSMIVAKNKKVKTLTFEGCDLNSEQILSLSEWIKMKSIRYLTLLSSLSPIVTHNFVLSLKDNEGNAKLKKLVIDQTPGIDVSSLISYIPNIQVLSLQYCDFEITEFFYAIYNTPGGCRIRSAFISGNRCARRIQPKMKFPPYLTEISVSDIYWESESLRNFFASVLHHEPKSIPNNEDNDDDNNNVFNGNSDYDENNGNNSNNGEKGPLISLDISNAKLKPEYWTDFFKHVQVMKSRKLGSLKWDMNPLHKVFFLFFGKCPELDNISLNGCFSPDDPLLPFCIEFLNNNEKITKFSTAGTSRKWLGPHGTSKIIQCLSTNRSIREFNISNNRSGQQMFIDLARILMKNRLVEAVDIDGNDIKELGAFRTFFEMMRERGRPLKITWPEVEINDMLQYGTANKDEVTTVKQLYQIVVEGNNKTIVRPETLKYIRNQPTNGAAAATGAQSGTPQNAAAAPQLHAPIIEEKMIVMAKADDIL